MANNNWKYQTKRDELEPNRLCSPLVLSLMFHTIPRLGGRRLLIINAILTLMNSTYLHTLHPIQVQNDSKLNLIFKDLISIVAILCCKHHKLRTVLKQRISTYLFVVFLPRTPHVLSGLILT